MDKFVGMTGAKGDLAMKPGEKYAIVDCGGKLKNIESKIVQQININHLFNTLKKIKYEG